MKKLLLLLTVALSTLTLSACNMDMGWGNYHFTKIHYVPTNECFAIISWHDNEMGVEVKTEDYGTLYFSEGTYVMIEDKCPFCAHNSKNK